MYKLKRKKTELSRYIPFFSPSPFPNGNRMKMSISSQGIKKSPNKWSRERVSWSFDCENHYVLVVQVVPGQVGLGEQPFSTVWGPLLGYVHRDPKTQQVCSRWISTTSADILQIFQPSHVKYIIHLGVTEVAHGDHTTPPKFGG